MKIRTQVLLLCNSNPRLQDNVDNNNIQFLPSIISVMSRSFDDGTRLNSSLARFLHIFFSLADIVKACKDVEAVVCNVHTPSVIL